MSTPEAGLQTQIRNIERDTGRTMAQWGELIQASGKTKHNDVVAWLKAEHSLPHGSAHRISLATRESAQPRAAAPDDPIAALYAGPKAALRPIHDHLLASLPKDVELSPKKGYVSLRRKKQFAMLQPAAKQLDLGLILKDQPVTERFESAIKWNALFTHRIRLSSEAVVDDEVLSALRRAYDAAG
ncbi:MAG: DUF4287 domain-containing protein [Chloroflexi bacterium]|nr:DUF4287 domain-containing protein [Chloroflexota bacterium]